MQDGTDSGMKKKRKWVPRTHQVWGSQLSRLLGLLLLMVALGACSSAAQRVMSWWGKIESVSRADSVLHSVYSRQRQFIGSVGRYANNLSELRLRLSPEEISKTKLLSFKIGGRPGYLVEYCDGVSCRSIDALGDKRSAYLILAPAQTAKPPVLTEFEGRYFARTHKPKPLAR